MLPALCSARRNSVRGLVASFAMAVALAGGAVATSAVIAPAAYAQDYSSEFRTAYQPVQTQLGSEMPDWQAIRAQLPAVEAAATTPDDLNAAGSIYIQAGGELQEPALQRRGLEMRLQSGKVDPAMVGQFQFFVASLAFNADDYPAARTAIEAALAAGYVDENEDPRDDPEYIYMQTYFNEENFPAALDYMVGVADARLAAGQTIPEQWLLVSLQEAYQNELVPQATDIAATLIRSYPSTRNWTSSLQVLGALNEFSSGAQLDLLRLQRLVGALDQRAEYIQYAENADPRIMANEVLDVLAEGIEAGIFSASDDYYSEVHPIAQSRAAEDRNSIEEYIADGEAGDQRLALSTGDVLYSLDDFARAERFYQMALDKGADRDTALTRIGITQVRQGNLAAAQETFAQVSGERAPIAKMWAVYAAQQAG